MKHLPFKKSITLSPKSSKLLSSFEGVNKSFFSISLTHEIPDPYLIASGIQWLRQYTPKNGLLIGDSLFAKTLVIQEGLTLIDAAQEAETQTSVLLRRVHSISNGNCSVLRSEALLSTTHAKRSRARFKQFFQDNSLFSQVIKKGAEEFCKRQERNGHLALPLKEAVELSCDYLIDEVVMYELLAQNDWLVEAHIGKELPVLQMFMDGDFPGISPALEKRKYIELKIKHHKARGNS